MNHEPELITKDGNEFVCGACGARFDQSGKVVPVQKAPKPRVGAIQKPIPKNS